MSIVGRVVEEVFPFVAYVRNVRKLRRLATAEDLFDQKPKLARYRALPEAQLTERIKEERSRATALDEKTFKITLALTVGLTVIGTTSAVLIDTVAMGAVKTVVAISLAVAVTYILAAGLIALGALKTQPSFGYGTEPLLIEPDKRQAEYADHLARQEFVNQTRHIRNEASYQTLRNGLVVLMVTIVIATIARAAGL
jgi:hypothetical protein